MLARPGIVVAPGVCDGISARCALEAGFDCLYQRRVYNTCVWESGYQLDFSCAATTAAKLGMPDLAIATLPDFVQNATIITGLSYSTPLIADADTGLGGPAMVARTVQMYDRAGITGLHIEDQFTTNEAEEMGAKIIIFSLVSCIVAAHGVREAMALLKKTGTDHTSARRMDPRKFFKAVELDEVSEIDRRAGGTALGSIMI
ncbi:unnamed protein product [Rhizoctonia solani]|uniref:Uncharacterized protein n=1 Tax=Rhizoctonia solani TaxID=456999 RepID=A0A8H3B089_9AGAM|nr:unnamed protein product [Rhizoctonia solani]